MSAVKKIKKGEVLFHERDSSNEMFIIKTGLVTYSKKIAGKKQLLGQEKEGGFIGALSFFDKKSREFTVTAEMDTELIGLKYDLMKPEYDRCPGWLRGFLNSLTSSYRQLQTKNRQLEAELDKADEMFPPQTLTQFASILVLVSEFAGDWNDVDDSLTIETKFLRRFTEYVFNYSNIKLQVFIDKCTELKILEVVNKDKEQFVKIHSIDVLVDYVDWMQQQSMKDPSDRIHLTKKEFKILSYILEFCLGNFDEDLDNVEFKLNDLLSSLDRDEEDDEDNEKPEVVFSKSHIDMLLSKGYLEARVEKDLVLMVDVPDLMQLCSAWDLLFYFQGIPKTAYR